MKNITAPIKKGEQGNAVANLQDGLLFLLEKAPTIVPDADRSSLIDGLRRERAAQTYADITSKTVLLFQRTTKKQFQLKATGDVDKPTAAALNTMLKPLGAFDAPVTPKPVTPTPVAPTAYTVSGVVRLADGSPVRNTNVSAFDRDLRSEQLLGQSRTDSIGAYQIGYTADQFGKSERGSADLVVKALAADGSLLAASPVLFNAPPHATIALTIPAQISVPPTLFEKIVATLPPLLDGVKVEQLEEDQKHQDLSFLVGETGFAKPDLARFVLAQLLAPQGIQAEFWFALLSGSSFQYADDQSLKAQLATVTDGLPSLDAATVGKAIARGFDQKDIPEALRGRTEDWIAAFLKIAARLTVRKTATPTFTKQALDHAGIKGATKQEKFALLFNEYQAMTPDLVAALQKDSTFAPAEIANLRASYQLADLTRGDFSVVKTIKDAFGVREPGQIRSLAMKSENEWVDLVKHNQAAGALTIPLGVIQPASPAGTAGAPPVSEAELYGKTLERQFREAFPTAAFAGGLGRALGNGGARGLQHAVALHDFLQQHEDFELLTTPVDDFLKSSINPGMRTLAQDESFRIEVKAAQRVFKLAPTFAATDALLADGLHSAQKIYRQGENEFVQRYAGTAGFTADSARLAWNRAADTHAAVLTVVGELMALDSGSLPAALQTSSTSVTSFPNWNNLFQSGDLCTCEDCRSVLSPAAYFADLLTFLKDRKAADPTFTVKDILFQRRPDLGFIELNCENALTPLPYIDVVCEVLEAVVAAGVSDVALSGFNAIPTTTTADAKTAVATALSDNHLTPGADFSLSPVDPNDPNRWVVHGDETTFLLTKGAATDFSARILRNTKASAAELRAYPAYVDAAAYTTLSSARFPFNLPFDLFAEEVRAAFQKCNLQRWDLMRTLCGPAANNPSDSEIAAEYFGISSDPSLPVPVSPADPTDEKQIILTAAPTNAWQQVFWGEPTIPGNVSNVKVFLQKTALEYNDLLTLLDLEFINPAGDITIHHQDASCDTDKKDIQNLDQTKLDRIHRFLRLWRKLVGWKMWEVDLVIRRFGIGADSLNADPLNETFLIKLFYFARLRTRLGEKTTVEQLCALCGDLNTETHFTKLYDKRGDGLYQSLFLNKRLVQPLDHAFDVTALGTTTQISAHLPVMLAGLRVSETELAVFKALTRASNNASYLTSDDLTIANISFLWRHTWLSKQLRLKPQEWAIVLKLFQQDIEQFADPRAAFEFVEQIDTLKASGFTPDELDWLFTANRAAKAATKEVDASRFLAALRKDLQSIQAEYDPNSPQYSVLSPPRDEGNLITLLTSLLQKLNRDEAETKMFLKTLRGSVLLEADVQGLGTGFTFPAGITGESNNIPIRYERVLRFSGQMTADQWTTLLNDPSLAAVTGLQSYQQAVQDLFEQPGQATVTGLPAGFTIPEVITGAPNNIPIRYESVLRFNGVMTDAQRTALLDDASPALAALRVSAQLETDVQGLGTGFTFPAGITGESNNIPIRYERVLRFSGQMTDVQKDFLLSPSLLGVAVAGSLFYQQAIQVLFERSGQVTVTGLPPDFTTFPLTITGENNIPIRYQSVMRFDGIMTAEQRTVLLDNSSPTLATVQLEASVQGLETGFTFPAEITGESINIPILYDAVNQQFRFTGLMTDTQREKLLNDPSLETVTENTLYRSAIEELYQKSLTALANYRSAIEELYRQSLTALANYRSAIEDLFRQSAAAGDNFVSAEVVELTNVLLPADLPSLPIRYNSTTQKLSFIGVMTNDERLALKAENPAVNPADAIDELFRLPRLDVEFFEPIFTAPLDVLPPSIDFKAQLSADLAAKISYDAEQRLLRFAGIMNSAEQVALNAIVATSVLPSELAYHAAIDSLATQPQAIALTDHRIWMTDNDLNPALPANDTLAKRLASAARKALDYLAKTLAANAVVQQRSANLGLTEALTRYLLTQYTFPALHLRGSMTTAQRTILLTDSSLPPAVTSLTSYQDAIEQLFQGSAQAWVSGLPAGFEFPAAITDAFAITDAPNNIQIRYEPITVLAHLTSAFATTANVVDYATSKTTFDGWFWANRVAAILKKWKVTLAELEKIIALTAGAQLLDFMTLPLDGTGVIASIDRFLRTSHLLRLRDSLPESEITFLDLLEKLSGGAYSVTDFAADVQRLNDAWTAADVADLVAALDAAYPNDYLLAETWERLRRAFYFIDSLNAGADTVKTFAAPAMGPIHAKTLKDLLRSKFGAETWLTLSAEIQDVLRERKRDALAAYLLAQQMPVEAPSGKWENTNDLYAYYLLDVEMCSCQLTSRLVQASGSVQLFVQRCFMGLEPDVEVKADGDEGDSAWRWWKWMRKFQVWVANRKVFLWPENWIAPELKKDRSPFFKDLENEIQQNEINQYNAETAFTNYLEKLDGVAQLEIAGFYQEDDGGDTIVHIFGRSRGAEPHLYYYRRYDYRQYTPWEKVELDIQGDYLIPAVVNKRLFLFWPVFTEVSDEAGNSTVDIPSAGDKSVQLQKTAKKLRLQMAVSDYRQGKWSPKRVSKDFDESTTYYSEIVKKHYRFFPIDRTEIDGRFGIVYDGSGTGTVFHTTDAGIIGRTSDLLARLSGAFEISGCDGVPAAASFPFNFGYALRPEADSAGDSANFLKWNELASRKDNPPNDFALETFGASSRKASNSMRILMQTPWLFQMSPPWHLSYLDKLLLDGQSLFSQFASWQSWPIGSWLPFFYNDKKRTFLALPCQSNRNPRWPEQMTKDVRVYYPEIKGQVRAAADVFEGQIRTKMTGFNVPAPSSPDRRQLEQFLAQQFPAEPPPYSDAQIKEMMVRYYMRSVHKYLGQTALALFQMRQFHFKNFYHPFVCEFAKLVNNPSQSIPGLMRRETQLKNTGFSFKQTYQPTMWVVDPSSEGFYPKEVVDFSPDGAYSSYNWELFFHAPLLIANALSRNQRFEEAREWYHFIFNPIGVDSAIPGGSAMSKFWITKPFFETTDPQYVQQRIDNILGMLNGNPDLESQVRDWRTNPFEPHRIANYRTVAYQKTVVMNYLDNLIAWGDVLFRQDSMESINEATQLYVLAAEILGPRPKKIPPQAKPPLLSFNELESEFDKFSNALVQVENLVPQLSGGGGGGNAPPLPMLYFCIPHNDKMLGYWDTIADRLYKIRHCMNIEGVVRQLALFEPPIDPGALVKAIAGGVDIGSALADLNAPLPLYRFNVLLQKANEICNDVKALGGALLGALEKKDAEALSLLRQGQEIKVLEATRAVREKQIEEAKENLEGITKSKVVAETRRNYYRDIERLTSQEKLHLDKITESQEKQKIAQGIKLGASIISILPHINLGISGFGGSPNAGLTIGGLELGQAAGLASDVLSFLSMIAANDAAMASSKASFDRRWDDWKFQERVADKELDQFGRQIAAGELRIAIAENELANHLIQIDNAKATDEFMQSKYTNEELYQWQVGQISGVYFQSYKLAYDLAKRAERCFRFELGLQDSSYISFGYWDSLKKGLLSGEKLQYDLRRLESAYLEQNRRELELTKHVSLLLLDPLALVKLRETGRCFFSLPEELFDLDYPGHYFRRIKSVSLTLPCVTGPYTTIACTLRLLKNSVRINTANGDNGYPRNTDDQGLSADDTRFIENSIPVKAIAASSGQNDSGVFEINFRDDRYLPFEGAGATSEWSLELFTDSSKPDFGRPLRQFDYGTISDAIVHVKYTAREDAGSFKNGAVKHLRDYFSEDDAMPSLRLFNLRQEFPSQWSRFLNPTNLSNGNIFELDMSADLFRMLDAGKILKVHTIWLLARCTGTYSVEMTPPGTTQPFVQSDPQFGGLWSVNLGSQSIAIAPTGTTVRWTIKMTNLDGSPGTQPIAVEDMFLVLGYEWD